MKKLFNIALVGLLFLGLQSCSDSNSVFPEPDLSAVNDEIAVNRVYEDMDNYTLTVLESSGLGARIMASQNESICAGVDINVNRDTKKIIVDFGQGCTSSSGITRKGKVILDYTGNFLFPGASVTTTFDGYEVEGLKVEGRRKITNTGIDLINSKVNLTVEVNNGKVTWPDNTFVSFNSEQVRSVSLGSQGYQIEITGTANGKGRAGANFNSSTISPLTVTQDCVDSGVLIPSRGVLGFVSGGAEVRIDYGTGTCDKTVILTYPGGSNEITFD